MNLWRPAYVGNGEPFNFKPALVVQDGDALWIENPLRILSGPESLARALAEAERHDFWIAYNEVRPVPSFPYLWAAIDTVHYLAFRVVRWQDLWEMPRPVGTFNALVEQFVELSRAYQFRPMLVMIPTGQDLLRAEAGDPPVYANVFADLQDSFGESLIVVDMTDKSFEATRFHLGSYAGHASAYGNQAIASAIAARLAATEAEVAR